ncbi:CPXCG motif-containing cysteine-rich protein [Thaumasiovibrio sp. DFM-14]|uniref:CPXCG motif-containing cysteine-rich protein n=1 Tax=Thaumasiovibrio sp. DFM-14 TaxID=3384792 RepID=UPI0039A26BD2
MNNFKNQNIICPHCGHMIKMTLDVSAGSQDFYDDCPACCNAIHLQLNIDEASQSIQLFVDADDEQIF